MIKNKLSIALIACFGLATMTSCDDGAVFDEVQSTGNQWAREDVKSFSYDAKDTLGYYNLFVNLRADHTYPYSNVFIIVKTSQPNGKAFVDTLQYEMADPTGAMLGNGLTDVKESALWFKSKHRFKYTGTYKFDIEHAVRKADAEKGDQVLEGVYDVGLRIEKAK